MATFTEWMRLGEAWMTSLATLALGAAMAWIARQGAEADAATAERVPRRSVARPKVVLTEEEEIARMATKDSVTAQLSGAVGRFGRSRTTRVGAALLLGLTLAAPALGRQSSVKAIEPTEAVLDSVEVADSEDLPEGVRGPHSALIQATFGVDVGQGLAVFKLSRSVFEEAGSSEGSGDVGALSWTTHSVLEYEWSTFPEYSAFAPAFEATGVRGAVLIGRLKGAAATMPAVALGFEVSDGQGGLISLLLPLAALPVDVPNPPTQTLAPAPYQAVPVSWPCTGAAGGGLPCSARFNALRATALSEFSQCMKDNASPLSWKSALCIIGCAFTGPAMPACVAACLGVPGGTTLIDYSSCSEVLDAAFCNAADVFCNCLRYQQDYCPQLAEPDVVGCPGTPGGTIQGCD